MTLKILQELNYNSGYHIVCYFSLYVGQRDELETFLNELKANNKIESYSLGQTVFNVSITNKQLNSVMVKDINTHIDSIVELEPDEISVRVGTSTIMITDYDEFHETTDIQDLVFMLESKCKLTNIHKKFPNVKELAFNSKSMDMIVGDVLGLLKMKNLKDVTNWCATEPEWFDIISTHFESKDILACQDELIENGLKEYAKL